MNVRHKPSAALLSLILLVFFIFACTPPQKTPQQAPQVKETKPLTPPQKIIKTTESSPYDATIHQMIWHQAIYSQLTQFLVTGEEIDKAWRRAIQWLHQNGVTATDGDQNLIDTQGADFKYRVKKIPYKDGFVINVHCAPVQPELKKRSVFNARRLAHYIQTGEQEKMIGPQVKMTILENLVTEMNEENEEQEEEKEK